MDKEEKTTKTLQEVLAGIPHRLLGGREDLPLAGLSFDSRAVVPSGAFVAIEGTAGTTILIRRSAQGLVRWCCARRPGSCIPV